MDGGGGRVGEVIGGSGRAADRSIHLFAAGSVVPASPLPAYLLAGKLFVIVSLDPDTDHARLVHNLLDDFAVFADDFSCATGKAERVKECSNQEYGVVMKQNVSSKMNSGMLCCSLTYKVPGYLKVVFLELEILSGLLHCLWGL